MNLRALLAAVSLFATTLGATSVQQLDSQLVLARYEMAMSDVVAPKTMIFSYTISQAGPSDIEQHHRLYRSGVNVRDEMLSDDGVPLKQKIVRIGQREDHYAVTRLAPRSTLYTMLFLRATGSGEHLAYEYEATPLAASGTGFTVTRVTIDGRTFLPRVIAFRTAGASAHGTGEISYGNVANHWVPLAVTVDAQIAGKPARERITWSDYRFPAALPASTFVAPKPLPHATLPPI
ncbi:MAG: hypothetical protein KGN02_14400 [bacterium]|nr:hypothetical protein [bacterium]